MGTHYGPWQPCWISNQHQKHKSDRDPMNIYGKLKSVQWIQRRRVKCEQLAYGRPEGRRTLTNDKSSHDLWPGELKSKNTFTLAITICFHHPVLSYNIHKEKS
jgi:hypothetical protein